MWLLHRFVSVHAASRGSNVDGENCGLNKGLEETGDTLRPVMRGESVRLGESGRPGDGWGEEEAAGGVERLPRVHP